jgi:hypothetical protein
MKPGASFAFIILNFTVDQDSEVARQDNLMGTSSSNQVRDKIPDELPKVNQEGASSESSDLKI